MSRVALRHVLSLTATVLLGLASPRAASAYSYESAVSTGCHERITQGALRSVRTQVTNAPVIPSSGNDLALIDDVPFTLDGDMRDLAAVALLIGVRDNDLHGRSGTDVTQLAAVHGNPDNQKEHCLRNVGDDEPGGSERALEACRAFMRGKLMEALDGLDASSVPDPNRRVGLDVTLSLRGKVSASLPLYWVRLGQALHTLQDGFSHTFRSMDRLRVRTVLNWIDYVEGTEDEARDGPLHRNGLDQCDGLDELQKQNIAVASLASVELMKVTLDPSLARDAKLAAIDATIAKYLSLEPGCTDANGWCDAPERKYEVAASCGCSVLGGRSGGLAAGGACVLGLALLIRRRRRGRAKATVALPIVLALLAAPSLASAQEPEQAPAQPQEEKKEAKPTPGVPTPTEAKAEQIEAERQSFFGIYAAGSGSVTNPGLSGQLGLRFRLSERWTVGLDGELNGWYAVGTSRFRTGAFNAYATGIFRYPLRFESINLRTTANLGTSTMLIDLYGAPRGTTGIFVGFVPLGLEYKLSRTFYVVFDALGIALPVPQLKGAPFAYPQYRTAVGLELAF